MHAWYRISFTTQWALHITTWCWTTGSAVDTWVDHQRIGNKSQSNWLLLCYKVPARSRNFFCAAEFQEVSRKLNREQISHTKSWRWKGEMHSTARDMKFEGSCIFQRFVVVPHPEVHRPSFTTLWLKSAWKSCWAGLGKKESFFLVSFAFLRKACKRLTWRMFQRCGRFQLIFCLTHCLTLWGWHEAMAWSSYLLPLAIVCFLFTYSNAGQWSLIWLTVSWTLGHQWNFFWWTAVDFLGLVLMNTEAFYFLSLKLVPCKRQPLARGAFVVQWSCLQCPGIHGMPSVVTSWWHSEKGADGALEIVNGQFPLRTHTPAFGCGCDYRFWEHTLFERALPAANVRDHVEAVWWTILANNFTNQLRNYAQWFQQFLGFAEKKIQHPFSHAITFSARWRVLET